MGFFPPLLSSLVSATRSLQGGVGLKGALGGSGKDVLNLNGRRHGGRSSRRMSYGLFATFSSNIDLCAQLGVASANKARQ